MSLFLSELAELWPRLLHLWPGIVSLIYVGAALAVTVDAVLRKRQVPTIIGWVGLAWLAPIIGALFYLWFGINRVHRTASAFNLHATRKEITALEQAHVASARMVAAQYPMLYGLNRLSGHVTDNILHSGNHVEPLHGGDDTYPAMLDAIANARQSITLCSYIFDNDEIGNTFLQALVSAQERGVQVRVLIDGVGARYTHPTMVRRLRRAQVPVTAFLPTRLPRLLQYANLRNHRKILVVDGRVGFTGGMNIRDGHYLSRQPSHPVLCLHFRLTGPVVTALQRTFATDWHFVTGETLDGAPWFQSPLEPAGEVLARSIPNGPDHDFDNMIQILLGALSVAHHKVNIVTPYFLPDSDLHRTLQVTALRGVEVNIILPAKSNVPLMDWAMTPQLSFLLEAGCRIYLSPPPFDHTKLMVVDDDWALIGSTNWDPRSLRLNFELNVECYDRALATGLNAHISEKIARARALTLEELYSRSFGKRLRDGLVRLLSPYL